MITEKPHYNAGMSAAMQFVAFIGLTVGLLILGNLVALGTIYVTYGIQTVKLIMDFDLSKPQAIKALWILQILGTTMPILLTPIIFGTLIIKEPKAYLKTNFHFLPVLLLIVFSVMVISSPIMEVLVLLNQKMVLPEFLKGVENWMRASEQQAQKATEALLHMNSWWDVVVAVLFIGLVTAVAEELMFRGCLQTIFIRWTHNTHVAIWITAALFSAFHMEFFGFFPRLMVCFLVTLPPGAAVFGRRYGHIF